MKTFQAICVLLVAGIVSACEEGADIVGVGKVCYSIRISRSKKKKKNKEKKNTKKTHTVLLHGR